MEGRNLPYGRILSIIRDEGYLSAIEADEIKRYFLTCVKSIILSKLGVILMRYNRIKMCLHQSNLIDKYTCILKILKNLFIFFIK